MMIYNTGDAEDAKQHSTLKRAQWGTYQHENTQSFTPVSLILVNIDQICCCVLPGLLTLLLCSLHRLHFE